MALARHRSYPLKILDYDRAGLGNLTALEFLRFYVIAFVEIRRFIFCTEVLCYHEKTQRYSGHLCDSSVLSDSAGELRRSAVW